MPDYKNFEIDRERFDKFLKEAKDALELNTPISKKIAELVKNGADLKEKLDEYISAKEKEERVVKESGEDLKKVGVESGKIKKQIEEVVGKEMKSVEEAREEINSLNEQEKILGEIHKAHTRKGKQSFIEGVGKENIDNKEFFEEGIDFLERISNLGKEEKSELILSFNEFNKMMKYINNNLNPRFKAESKEELEKHQQLVDIQKGIKQLDEELFKKDKETEDEEKKIDKETGQIKILFKDAQDAVGINENT